jgi:bifunctional non-homologous end joining protein LigD
LPLTERKKLLEKLLPSDNEVLRYSDHVLEKGNDFYKVALNKGLEGIMAKQANSIYQLDSRAETWLKIKVNLRQEVIIAGYTQPRKTRKFFGALLLGVYDGDELVYVGHSGSGFNKKSLEEIYNKLQPIVVKDCPFTQCPKGNMPTTWVAPKLICEIKFTEWTKERIARHPIFMGLRTDKEPKDVRFEKSKTINTMAKAVAKKPAKGTIKKIAVKKGVAKKASTKKATKGVAKTSGKKLDLTGERDQTIKLIGGELAVSSLDKFYWKKEGLTKGDSINYYLQMAPFILPYLIDRPLSLNRHPNGIDAPNFFQKDMKGSAPEWAQTHVDFSESTDVNVEYLVCNSEATLIYMANLGCIEMNPWHSRSQTWQQPDWCLIDLDPDKPNTFNQVIDVAHAVKKVLDSIGADCYVKTSGSSGIHIYIPLGAKYNFEQSKQLAELVVTMVNNELPDLTSVERNPAKRKGKIYLDFLQNRETQTAAAPYSLRPKRGAPVSTPLDWSEVKHGLTPTTYTMLNIFDRLKSEGDLFKPVLGKGINLQKVLRTLESIAT